MSLDADNIVVRLLVAVLVFFLLDKAIDLFVKDPRANEIFKYILIVVCLAIVFIGGVLLR